jgi:hypothetical protein
MSCRSKSPSTSNSVVTDFGAKSAMEVNQPRATSDMRIARARKVEQHKACEVPRAPVMLRAGSVTTKHHPLGHHHAQQQTHGADMAAQCGSNPSAGVQERRRRGEESEGVGREQAWMQ